jgi:hypothetical protein
VLSFPTTVTVSELRRASCDWIVNNCGDVTLNGRTNDGHLQLTLRV